MRGKKIVVFMCVLLLLTVLIILNSTVFTVQSISINWMTTKHTLLNTHDDDILKNFEKGGSIFLLNKQEVATKLEKENAYLRVVGIETKFPNKIVVHSAERETLFAVEINQNKYAVIDELGKVLDIQGSSIFAGSALGAKPIKVTFSNSSVVEDDYVVGESVRSVGMNKLLCNLSRTLREANYSPTASKGIFTNIDIVMGVGYDICFTTRNGLGIKIIDAGNYTTDKFLLGLVEYAEHHEASVVEGTIVVEYNKTLGCFARYELD